jgi:hypothetical protein
LRCSAPGFPEVILFDFWFNNHRGLSSGGRNPVFPGFNLIDKVNKVKFLRIQPATKVGEEKKIRLKRL